MQGSAQLALRPEPRSALERNEANRFIAQNAERMSLLVDDLQLLATLTKNLPTAGSGSTCCPSRRTPSAPPPSTASPIPSTSARCTPPPIPPERRNSMSRRPSATRTDCSRSWRTCFPTHAPTPRRAPGSMFVSA
ncbi:hypothetical protein [Streptomyces hokutonensis]|uniref:Uncharacterized protein n=1 Tax=Streptomyces hokutonensis TaxID=1306990 RepID=A0ABW6LZF9_9ACTN